MTDASPRPPVKSLLWPWIVVLLAVQLVLVLPVIFFPGAGNDADETLYHYPAVLQIYAHWPQLDWIHDSLAATPPGYHYFLATCAQLAGPSLLAMRLINMGISLCIPVLLFVWLSYYAPLKVAFIYTLPVALCCFFLKSSSRVVTDNAALFLTLLSLMSIFLLPARGWRGTLTGLSTSLAVLTRQLTLSLVGPALLQVVLERFRLFEESSLHNKSNPPPSNVGFLPSFGIRLLPIFTVLFLIHIWHGLVPPAWQNFQSTLSAAPLDYILAVVGFIGIFFVLSLGSTVTRQDWKNPWVFVGGLAGFFISLISATTWSLNNGRWGGWIWLLVHHLPSFGQRSVVFMILTPLGMALLCLMTRLLWKQGQRQAALLWSCSVAAWMSSYALNTTIHHHYYEAPIMIFLAVGCLLIVRRSEGHRFRWWPLLLLLGYDVALIVVEIYGNVFFQFHASDV